MFIPETITSNNEQGSGIGEQGSGDQHGSGPSNEGSAHSNNENEESSSKTPKVRSLYDLYENTHSIDPPDFDACQLALSLMEPVTFKEAVEHEEWIEAMNIELQALKDHQTWTLVDLPKEKKAIGLKWV